MKTLASETLAHIFSMGTLIEPKNPLSFRDASTFAVLISHVSSYWRELALSTPRLWRTIFASGPFPPLFQSYPTGLSFTPDNSSITCPMIWRRQLDRIHTYLRRSWPVPLIIYLDLRDPSWSFDTSELSHPFHPSYMSQLLDLLLPHLSRWEDIEVLSDTWKPLYIFMQRCQLDSISGMPNEHTIEASMLRRLSLHRCNAYLSLEGKRFLPLDREEPISLFHNVAPLLHDVSLSGVHVSWTSVLFRNLSALELCYHAKEVLPSLPEFVDILKASPNLERLAIVGWGVRSVEENSPPSRQEQSIVLPRLRHLIIGWVNVRHMLKLCELFSWRMPELHTLELEDVSNSLELNFSQDSSPILDYLSSNLLGMESPTIGESPRGIRYLRVNYLSASKQSYWRLMNRLERLAILMLHNVQESLVLLLASSWEYTDRMTPLLPGLRRVLVGSGYDVSRPVLELLASVRKAQIIEVKPGRLVRENSEAWSRSENQKLIIEVESLYDSESEIDDHLTVGNKEDDLVGCSSPGPCFDQPIKGKALFQYIGDETESYCVSPKDTSSCTNGSVRDSYVSFYDADSRKSHTVLFSDVDSAPLLLNRAVGGSKAYFVASENPQDIAEKRGPCTNMLTDN